MGLWSAFISRFLLSLGLRLMSRRRFLGCLRPISRRRSCFSMQKSMNLGLLSCRSPNGLRNDPRISLSSHHTHFSFPQTTYPHTRLRSWKSFYLRHEANCPSTYHHNDPQTCKTLYLFPAFDPSPSHLCTTFAACSSSRQPNTYLAHVSCLLAIRLHICHRLCSTEYQSRVFCCLASHRRTCWSRSICLAFRNHLHWEAAFLPSKCWNAVRSFVLYYRWLSRWDFYCFSCC